MELLWFISAPRIQKPMASSTTGAVGSVPRLYSDCSARRSFVIPEACRPVRGEPGSLRRPAPTSDRSQRQALPWVSLGDEPFSPEGWDGDQAVKAGVNAPQAPLEQGGEGSGIAPGSAMAGVFSARVVPVDGIPHAG